MIISFDDFGISETANDNMLELLAYKKADRVSIMMNGVLRPADVTSLITSGVKLDIHLDRNDVIDEDRKLKDGFFKRFTSFMASYMCGATRSKVMSDRWEGQILRFYESFQKFPDGISSHEHVHFFPAYFEIIIKLAKKYNISYMRFGSRATRNYNVIAFILNILRSMNRGRFLQSSLQTSDFLVSWDWVDRKESEMARIFNENADKKTELIFHPERPEEFSFLKNQSRSI